MLGGKHIVALNREPAERVARSRENRQVLPGYRVGLDEAQPLVGDRMVCGAGSRRVPVDNAYGCVFPVCLGFFGGGICPHVVTHQLMRTKPIIPFRLQQICVLESS
jgi:hypothetical protein